MSDNTGLLDIRKMRILQAIVDDYIMTAAPVGSRTVSKRSGSPSAARLECGRSQESCRGMSSAVCGLKATSRRFI